MIAVCIIGFFGAIHLIEMTAFTGRMAGLMRGQPSMSYMVYNSVVMMTRVFTMLMLPMLGYIVDIGVSKSHYFTVWLSAVLVAGAMSILCILFRSRSINAFGFVLDGVLAGRNMLLMQAKFPIYFLRSNVQGKQYFPFVFKVAISHRVFWMSAVVFAIYATSIFGSFYIALINPLYTTSISHMSGVTNALATVLLTYWIEPRISVAIDRNENASIAVELLGFMILGRVFGVLVMAPLIAIGVYTYV